MKTTAIILAAGKGKRMGTSVSKQYLELQGYPILYYTIRAFEDSVVDNIVLVTGSEETEYCRKNIVDYYKFNKVKAIAIGGKERYDSVHAGLKMIKETGLSTDIVLIHDGARPFVTDKIIEDTIKVAAECGACVAAVKAKDTIKLADTEGFIGSTPDRNNVWQIQTPQTFSYNLIKDAYDMVLRCSAEGITDDAMILEKYGDYRIKLVESSYDNIKITTPEDLDFGGIILEKRKNKKN